MFYTQRACSIVQCRPGRLGKISEQYIYRGVVVRLDSEDICQYLKIFLDFEFASLILRRNVSTADRQYRIVELLMFYVYINLVIII